jgi:hypothetical protein
MAGQGRTLAVLGGVLAAGVAAALWLVLGGGGTSESGGEEPPPDAAPGVEGGDGAGRPGPKRPPKRAGTASVVGEVRRTKGKVPVVGQEVRLLPQKGDPLTARTDARGAFSIDDLPHGVPFELRVEAPSCGTIRMTEIVLERDEKRALGTLWLDPSVRLPVQVRTWSDQPVEGALVEAFFVVATDQADPSRSSAQSLQTPTPVAKATTDAAGEAVFPELATGRFTFTATKPGFGRAGRAGVVLRADAPPPAVKLHLGTGYSLSGRVLDPAKNPVAGAVVFASAAAGWESSAPMRARATSDAEGRYEFASLEPGDETLWVAKPGATSPQQIVTLRVPDVQTFDIHLKPTATLAGAVTSAGDGRPLEGAGVRAATWGAPERAGTSVAQGVTDAEGRYALALDPGTIGYVLVEKDGWTPADDPQGARSLTLSEGETLTRDLKMKPGAKITGVVRGPEGPLAGAKVWAMFSGGWGGQSQKHAVSDGDGRYSLDGLAAGKAVVRADLAGWYVKDLPENFGAILQQPGPSPFRVELAEGGAATVDLLMARGQTVEGRVEAADRTPLEGVRVTTSSETDGGVLTGADGAFRLEGVKPSAAMWLVPSKEGWSVSPSNRALVVTADEPTTGVVLRMSRLVVVKGTVTAPDGAPPRDARVSVHASSDGGAPGGLQTSRGGGQGTSSAPVRPDGTYEIQVSGQAPGTFRITASAPGSATASSDAVSFVEDRSEYVVDLKLDGGRDVEGRVLSKADGLGVPGAQIVLAPRPAGAGPNWRPGFGVGNSTVWAVTGPDGSFRVAHLAAGGYSFGARADGFVTNVVTVDAASGAQVDIRLEPELSIDGAVTFSDGSPVEGIGVSAAREETGPRPPGFDGGAIRSATTTTGAGGRFRLGGLSSGAWRLTVAAGRQGELNVRTKKTDPVAAGTTGLRVVVDQGGVVSGRVLDPRKRPLADVSLSAVVEDKSKNEGENRGARTKADGSFALVGLLDGATYQITVQTSVAGRQGDAGAYKSAVLKGVVPGTRDLDIVLEEGLAVSGVIVSADDKPVAGEYVFCAWTSPDGKQRQSRGANTDPAGAFSFGGFDVGDCSIQFAGASAQKGMLLQGADKVPAGTKGLRLVAVRAAVITGSIVDEGGHAVPGANAQATSNVTGRSQKVGARPDGSFEISGLAPGAAYTVTATGYGRVTARIDDVQSGTAGLRLVLAKGFEASGRVVDAENQLMRGVHLRFELAGDSSKTANCISDENGKFVVKGLVEGTYDVQVNDPEGKTGGTYKPCGKVTAGATNAELRLQP